MNHVLFLLSCCFSIMHCRCRLLRTEMVTCPTVCCFQLPTKSIRPMPVEPIFKAFVKRPDSKPIHCLPDKCDHCLIEYLEKNLQHGYGQLSQNQKETLEIGRPNAVVTSPNLTIDDEQMMSMQDEAIDKLREKNEFRKRFAIMQTDNGVFILGGFNVDAKTQERLVPKSDYFYDNESKKLIPIPPLPGNGRMGFGLAATDDDKIIGVGGHNLENETMSNVTMLDTNADPFEWEDLPELPDGTIGPGVSVLDNILYVVGGFEFISHDALCHGEVLQMDLDQRTWKNLPDIDPPRARPLISILDGVDQSSLIVAGGYNFDQKGKSKPYGKIETYNPKKKRWEYMADIPNFKTTNGLATKNNKLYLTELVTETGENRIIKEYNMETRKWRSSKSMDDQKDPSKSRRSSLKDDDITEPTQSNQDSSRRESAIHA